MRIKLPHVEIESQEEDDIVTLAKVAMILEKYSYQCTQQGIEEAFADIALVTQAKQKPRE